MAEMTIGKVVSILISDTIDNPPKPIGQTRKAISKTPKPIGQTLKAIGQTLRATGKA